MKDIRSFAKSGTLFDGRYKLLRPLSSDGGTADVWLALDTNTIDEIYDEEDDQIKSDEETGIKVAIKIYRPKNALDVGEQRFREEFKIVFNCHHSNLVQPINFSIYEGIPYLVLPYCKNGSSERLQGKLKDKDELWRYISDVSSGLAYLHAFDPTIVHHDIKPANILVDDSNNFAITDFGISSHRGLNREGYDDSQSGTMAYMAPERFKDDYESIPESDIWSFGATLYELVTGKVPFGEDGGLKQLEAGVATVDLNGLVSHDIAHLISDCLSLDVSKRPSAEYIKSAAAAKEYPLQSKKKTVYFILSGVIIVVAFLLIMFLRHTATEEKEIVIPGPSVEDRYTEAMSLLKSSNADNLAAGLALMDSLGDLGYVPALYQQAFTYGWYSDSASLSRKQILGIEVYPIDSDTNNGLLPKSKDVNETAAGLFNRIIKLNDGKYPEINADVYYRLACYYVNDNDLYKKDVARAEKLLMQSRKWAEKCNDKVLLERIDEGLNQLNLSKH